MAPLSARNVSRQALCKATGSSFGRVETFLATPAVYNRNNAGRLSGVNSIGE